MSNGPLAFTCKVEGRGVDVARLRRRSRLEQRLTGYTVTEFSRETKLPREAVLAGIHNGQIKAERRGKRWWSIPYSERQRLLEEDEDSGEAAAA